MGMGLFTELDRFTQMVTKTEICSYTAHKIYPGRGRRFVAKDGKTSYFLSQKVRSMFHQGIKKVYLGWTQEWRAKHKKIKWKTPRRDTPARPPRSARRLSACPSTRSRDAEPRPVKTATRFSSLPRRRSRNARPRRSPPRKP